VCFQVPALLRDQLTLVISPLIALMQDQVAAAQARGLPAACLHSGQQPDQRAAVLENVAKGAVKLLYAAPERGAALVDELGCREVRVGLLAVDEAHCISEWGHDFRPAYRSLRRVRARLGWPPAVALTGSATPAVRSDIAAALGLGRRGGYDLHLSSFDRPNLWFAVVPVRNERERLARLLELLALEERLAILYAPTRSLAEDLARVLRESGYRASAYHAGLTPTRRREVLDRFLADRLEVVVATCAFGLGIDKPNVRLVAHWSMPPTPEAYYQEAGRAGRDGAFARCVLLFRPGDAELPRRELGVTFPPERLCQRVWREPAAARGVPRNVLSAIDRLRRELRPERGEVDWLPVRRRRREADRRIAVMEQYATGRRCRRPALLDYFGERLVRCSGCDVCGTTARAKPRSREVRDRLRRLRLELGSRESPWRGSVLDGRTLLRLAAEPPASVVALAAVPGVGPILADRLGVGILRALGVDPRPARAGSERPASADSH